MALQIYNSNIIGAGTQINIGATDDLYIGPDGFISCTDNNYDIRGAGSNQSVTIEGRVLAQDWAIMLGNVLSTQSNQRLVIGQHASVHSLESYAIGISAYNSYAENNGVILGAEGITMDAFVPGWTGTGTSVLVNNGIVHATKFDAVERNGPEDFHFINNGTVRTDGASSAYYGVTCTGAQILTNNGKMTGTIYLGSGDDIYNGAHGRITGGYTYCRAGDDTFTGGVFAEYVEGDAGRDILKGGAGADHFIFTAAADSTVAKAGRDLIQDFGHIQHDKIDLLLIDAAVSSSGTNEAFSFIGTQAFSGDEGELRYSFEGRSTFIYGDTDADKHADFAIELKGHIALHAGDFIL